jgi:hypothetical protein
MYIAVITVASLRFKNKGIVAVSGVARTAGTGAE